MKITRNLLFIFLSIFIYSSGLLSQTNKEQILAVRNASNQALKSYDNEKVLSYLTDDVLTTTGSGTLLSGKKALADYIIDGGESKMYWIRDTKEVLVNEKRGLAWENGIWNAYDPEKGSQSIINGNYSAMWTKESDGWKIKPQLFVSLN
ncbi:nuclear transport factor 2 family protein [Maribacter algarum]|uniref:Nuclear transport factor 2 family protein n=1 Tax=Maribacter algarum (ex Zhang et al. 2020) TaxID=2578118 RepID=A0A5S3PCC7_9FLAO|nr:nuclear transport factor 2 family protein [Maribacter algarum]TMM51449.1 nuclear transport factor 2 family protein [Maribacter algarum]